MVGSCCFRVRDPIGDDLGHIGEIDRDALEADSRRRKDAREGPVAVDLLARHQERDAAKVDVEVVGSQEKAALEAAPRHVRRIAHAVFERVGERDLDPAAGRRELVLEAKAPVVLVPFMGSVHMNGAAVQYDVPGAIRLRDGVLTKRSKRADEADNPCPVWHAQAKARHMPPRRNNELPATTAASCKSCRRQS